MAKKTEEIVSTDKKVEEIVEEKNIIAEQMAKVDNTIVIKGAEIKELGKVSEEQAEVISKVVAPLIIDNSFPVKKDVIILNEYEAPKKPVKKQKPTIIGTGAKKQGNGGTINIGGTFQRN